MAYRDVEPDDDFVGGQFFNFTAIGDKLEGVYLGNSPARGQYAKEGDKCHQFMNGKGDILLLTPPASLARALNKLDAEGDLQKGAKIKMQYTANKSLDGDRTMKLFKVQIDTDFIKSGIEFIKKNAKTAESQEAEEDVPF